MIQNGSAVEEIERLEEARYAATLTKDDVALARLFDDKLLYVHSSGVADSKQSYLEGLRAGIWDYHSIERSESSFIDDGDSVLMFCKLSIRITVSGVYKAFDTRALVVWRHRPEGWRLLAVHSGAVSATP